MLINVVVCQLPIGAGLSLAEKIYIFKRKPDFVCLPEYFLMPGEAIDYASQASQYHRNLKWLARLSKDLDTILIGGTVIEKTGANLYNTAFVFSKGAQAASYRKHFPTEGEMARGISAGQKYIMFQIDNIRVALLICADVLHEEAFRKLGKLKTDLIFVPTSSPLRSDDSAEDKMDRDESIFVQGAKLSGAYVIKTCGLGTIFGHKLNGRSSIAAPWGIIWQVPPESEQQPHLQGIILDLEELKEFRRATVIREVLNKFKIPE